MIVCEYKAKTPVTSPVRTVAAIRTLGTAAA